MGSKMSGGIYDTNKIIRAENVSQQFKTAAGEASILKSIDFSIQANSFNVIFGQSGSGKTTLLNILAGIQAPYSGNLYVQGKDIYGMSSDELAHFRASKVGFIQQKNYWIKSLNVLENVSVPLHFLGYARKDATKAAMVALDRVNMTSYAHKSPLVLSGGEQQRIAIARAFANDPLFIIADEPTGSLDTQNGDMVMKLLVDAQSIFRRTVIVVTHNMEYVALANHLLKMEDGVLEDIPSNDIRRVTEMLVSDVKNRIKELSKVRNDANRT